MPAREHAAQETVLARKRRARKINRGLAELYPYAHPELDFRNAYELVVATVLSAQTTDVRVNMTTPALFTKYPDAKALAEANVAELETMIQPTGFFRAKTRSLISLATRIVDEYDGKVPARLEDLVTLSGVGRKTANVVLANAFGIPGISVDTHFGRLARRFDWTESQDPVQVEKDVAELFEPEGLDHGLPPGDFPRAEGLPCPQACVRGLRHRHALSILWRGRDGPGEGEEIAQVRVGAGQ